MIAARPGSPGATRTCPHCKSTVLASASVCPACQHHLRFNTQPATTDLAPAGHSAFQVEGTVRHKQAAEPCEFCVVLTISTERGEQISRQVVGVGALKPAEARKFNISVNLLPSRGGAVKA